jgi:uncharacterized protein with FMN-binding domain
MITRRIALAAAALAVACSMAPVLGREVRTGSIPDGVYEGRYRSPPNSARVQVDIEGGRIARVTLLHHGASWIGAKAAPVIPGRIVEKQSTDVDAVSGATNSSRVIMNAVQDALDRAPRGAAPVPAVEPEQAADAGVPPPS